MAQKTVVETFDDVTGERINTDIVPSPTISFMIDGREYEIDLGVKNRDKFYAELDEYTKVARKVGGRRTASRTATQVNSSPKRSKDELDKIRSWAREAGRTVAPRGRLAADLVDAYREAHA